MRTCNVRVCLFQSTHPLRSATAAVYCVDFQSTHLLRGAAQSTRPIGRGRLYRVFFANLFILQVIIPLFQSRDAAIVVYV